MARCEMLAECSEDALQLTRTFLSSPMKEVHAQLRTWMEEVGMQVRLDAAGNIIGRYEGEAGSSPTLLIGSHLDTVRNAGKYDGTLGVLLGVAAISALHERGQRLPLALEVIGFSEEEGIRYHTPFLGSRAVAGSFEARWLELSDDHGHTMRETLQAFGCDPNELPNAAYAPETLRGFLEIHIEQGPRLAALSRPLGVAEAIVGLRRARITFAGEAGHAGTVPMRQRRDALAGAAEFVLAAEAYARSFPDLVATVGVLEPKPGAINVISGETSLTLDVRHAKNETLSGAYHALGKRAAHIGESRNLRLNWQDLSSQAAVPLDAELSDLLSKSHPQGLPKLVSGAGHDAMVMAPFTPSALLFVRSPNGVSHHPDEMVLEPDVTEALQTTLTFLMRLAEGSV